MSLGHYNYSINTDGTVNFKVPGDSDMRPQILSDNFRTQLIGDDTLIWNPFDDELPYLFTEQRERDECCLRDGTYDIPANDKRVPQKFSKETEDRTYSNFLCDVMLFMYNNNVESRYWLSTFYSLLAGQAQESLALIRHDFRHLTFQRAVIELGMVISPPLSTPQVQTRLSTLRYDGSYEGIDKLAKDITKLTRQLPASKIGSAGGQEQAALTFNSHMPSRWRERITTSSTLKNIRSYAEEAKSIFIDKQLNMEQDAYLRVAQQTAQKLGTAAFKLVDPISGEIRRTPQWQDLMRGTPTPSNPPSSPANPQGSSDPLFVAVAEVRSPASVAGLPLEGEVVDSPLAIGNSPPRAIKANPPRTPLIALPERPPLSKRLC